MLICGREKETLPHPATRPRAGSFARRDAHTLRKVRQPSGLFDATVGEQVDSFGNFLSARPRLREL